MISLIKRHTTLFLKDRMSVFFSLLSVFIIIALYLLFLSENIASNLPEFSGQSTFVFLWMFAGIIAVTTATAALGALGKFIEDKVSKRQDDFLITKITAHSLAYSYVIYTFIIGLILTILLLLFGSVYVFIALEDNLIVSLQLFTVVILGVLMHTLFFYLITSGLRTMSAFSGLSTIVGTLIGFLAGIYIPIGFLPIYLQKIITFFPTTQVAVLLKNILMTDVLASIEKVMPTSDYEDIVVTLGVNLQWNGQLLSTTFSYIYIIGFILLLIGLVIIRHRKKLNTKKS